MDKIEILLGNINNSLEKLDNKVDKLDSRLDNVDITLGKQEVQLAEHIRRTNILETKLEPVEDHVRYVHGAFKLVGVLGATAGVIITIYKLINLA